MAQKPTNQEASKGPEMAVLSGEQASRVHAAFQHLFEQITPATTGVPADCIAVGFESLQPAVEETPEAREDIAMLFCRALIERVRVLHKDTGHLSSPVALRFLDMVRFAYFNPQQSDVTRCLSDIELMKFTREFTQIPCAHLDVGKYAAGEVIKRLENINPNDIPSLIDALHALPLSERLDLAQLFPSLARDLGITKMDHAHAMFPSGAQTVTATRQRVIDVLTEVMDGLEHSATSALETIALANARNRSLRELRPAVHPEGLTSRIYGSSEEGYRETHDRLARHMHVNTIVHKDERIVTLGNNAVGVMSSTGMIRDIGDCRHGDLEAASPFSTTVIEDLHRRLDRGLVNSLFFDMVDEQILAHTDPPISREEFWAAVFPDVPKNVFDLCLKNIATERVVREQGAQILLGYATHIMQKRSDAMRESADEISPLLDKLRRDPFLGQFTVYLDRFTFFHSVEIPPDPAGIPHQAMQAINDLILHAERQMDVTHGVAQALPTGIVAPRESPLLERVKQLRDKAFGEDRRLTQAFNHHQAEASAAYRSAKQPSDYAFAYLKGQLENNNGTALLHRELGWLDAENLLHLPSVDFWPTAEFLSSSRFYPFKSAEKDDEMATFALLHTPETRSALEQQMGVSYDDMSLESLFQLGRFLRHKRPEDFQAMCDVLKAQEPGAKKNVLTSFLACAEDISFGDIILRLAEKGGADDIFSMHAKAVASAQESAREIHALYAEAQPHTTVTIDDIYRELIAGSNELLAQADSGKNLTDIRKKLFSENMDIRNTNYVLRLLPPSERTQLDLLTLKSTKLHSSVPVSELRTNPDYSGVLAQIVETIRANFPAGDDQLFMEKYLHDPKAQFFFSTCGGQLLAFFGTTLMPNGERYLDWFNANKDSDVRGLAEATVCTGIRNFPDHKDVYLVAKPHVRSHEIFNRMGFVTYGITDDTDHYQHHYLRCRLLENEDATQYVGKNLTEGDTQTIMQTCGNANEMHALRLHSKQVHVCKVHFHAVDHHNDIGPDDAEHGFLFRELADRCKDNQSVLTAYIRDPKATNGDQVYYCLFEQSVLDQKNYDALAESVRGFHH